jgi:hypothetical protein
MHGKNSQKQKAGLLLTLPLFFIEVGLRDEEGKPNGV